MEDVETGRHLQYLQTLVHETWLQVYNTSIYRNSLFFKGPMLYSTSGILEGLENNVFFTIKSFKIKIINIILNWQSEEDKTEWKPDNFVLSKFNGLRSSASRNTFCATTF